MPHVLEAGHLGAVLRLTVCVPCVQVLAPGLYTLFKHRLDSRRVSQLSIQGDVVITQVSYDAGPVSGRDSRVS